MTILILSLASPGVTKRWMQQDIRVLSLRRRRNLTAASWAGVPTSAVKSRKNVFSRRVWLRTKRASSIREAASWYMASSSSSTKHTKKKTLTAVSLDSGDVEAELARDSMSSLTERIDWRSSTFSSLGLSK